MAQICRLATGVSVVWFVGDFFRDFQGMEESVQMFFFVQQMLGFFGGHEYCINQSL